MLVYSVWRNVIQTPSIHYVLVWLLAALVRERRIVIKIAVLSFYLNYIWNWWNQCFSKWWKPFVLFFAWKHWACVLSSNSQCDVTCMHSMWVGQFCYHIIYPRWRLLEKSFFCFKWKQLNVVITSNLEQFETCRTTEGEIWLKGPAEARI